jgi:acylphosphatase
MERAKITAKGKVQGVGFRNFIYIIAFESNLLGYTANLKNGDVETVVEGEKPVIESLIQSIREGNILSRVDEVLVEWNPPTGEFHDFKVKR